MTTPTMQELKSALVDGIGRHFAAGATPRVAELLKPPGLASERVSPFTMLGLDDGSAGLAWNLLATDDDRRAYDELDPTGFVGRDAMDLTRGFVEGDQVERIVGYTACHALSQIVLARGGYRHHTGADLLSLAQPSAGDHVGMVGFSTPLVRAFCAKAERVTVLEARDRSTRLERVHVTRDAQELSACDKVLITSTSLLNESFAELAQITRGASFRAVYGPGAGVLPDLFFELGFHAMAGMIVLDGALLLERQRTGKKWREAKRKCVLVPEA